MGSEIWRKNDRHHRKRYLPVDICCPNGYWNLVRFYHVFSSPLLCPQTMLLFCIQMDMMATTRPLCVIKFVDCASDWNTNYSPSTIASWMVHSFFVHRFVCSSKFIWAAMDVNSVAAEQKKRLKGIAFCVTCGQSSDNNKNDHNDRSLWFSNSEWNNQSEISRTQDIIMLGKRQYWPSELALESAELDIHSCHLKGIFGSQWERLMFHSVYL